MYFAAYFPRNFGNEYTIKGFYSEAERNEFCERINSDVNQTARALSHEKAQQWARYNGNEITEAFVHVEDDARWALNLLD
jgi:hypothetical protein